MRTWQTELGRATPARPEKKQPTQTAKAPQQGDLPNGNLNYRRIIVRRARALVEGKEKYRLLRRLLLDNAAPRWRSYALSFGLLLLASGATAATAYIMKDVVDEIFINRRKDQTFFIASVIACIFIAKGLASYAGTIVLARTGNAITAGLQRQVYETVLSQNLGFFDSVPMGRFVTIFQNGSKACCEVINMLVLSIGRDLFTLVGLIGVMFYQDPLMSLVFLLVLPPAVLGVMYLMRKVTAIAKGEFAVAGRLVDAVKETVGGIKVIKSYILESPKKEEFSETVAILQHRKNKIAQLRSLTMPLMDTLAGIGIAMIVVYSGLGVIDRGMEPGAFFSFIAAFLLAWDPARRLAVVNVTFQQKLIAVGKVYAVLEMIEARSEHNSGEDLVVGDGAIALENVTFSYRKGKDAVLKDLTLDFEANAITALVGPSGGGKSTLLSLITRLREPDSGRILIDGRDIANVSAKSLRSAVSYVAQDSFLFDVSIRENIHFGNLDATEAEIEAAARAANAHEFILEQAKGYDTRVGDGGSLLSGGQRQRVAIARAILADSPIILLDEATSALDNISEKKVQEALQGLMVGRTTVVIAHRLTTVRNAKKIHVISEGRCVETGSHEELLAANGLYRRLHA